MSFFCDATLRILSTVFHLVFYQATSCIPVWSLALFLRSILAAESHKLYHKIPRTSSKQNNIVVLLPFRITRVVVTVFLFAPCSRIFYFDSWFWSVALAWHCTVEVELTLIMWIRFRLGCLSIKCVYIKLSRRNRHLIGNWQPRDSIQSLPINFLSMALCHAIMINAHKMTMAAIPPTILMNSLVKFSIFKVTLERYEKRTNR